MARILIVPFSSRAADLTQSLLGDGHVVRATSRDPDKESEIRASGAEPYIGDPDRIGTLMDALNGVSIICWLFGNAAGESESVRALHDGRLRMLFEKLADSPVRGVIYEAAGSLESGHFTQGRQIAATAQATWHIPVEIIGTDPIDRDRWLSDCVTSVNCLLGERVTASWTPSILKEDEREGDMKGYAHSVLVDTEWVSQHLDDPTIRIVEVDENPALYSEGHIPGAIGFDWKKDLQDPLIRDFLDQESFGKLFGSRGISNEHLIVLYGDRNNWFAAYTYWYLKYYGHTKVKLMNGSREKWIAEGRPVSSDKTHFEKAEFHASEGNQTIRAYRDDVFKALNTDTKLLDVRSPQEFSGEWIVMEGYEQEGAQRGGHIPGAVSVPWSQAVHDDGTFRSATELKKLYSSHEVINGNPVIVYCRIGERSAHSWLVLHELLGCENVKNYDGSWSEWGNLVHAPIEKGASRG